MLLRQRSQTIAVFPRPVIVGLIPNKEQSRRNSVTRLLQTRPLYYLYEIVTSPISSPTTSSKAWLYTLGTFKEANVTKPVSGYTLAADLIETRLGKEIIFASFESLFASLTRPPDNFL